MRTSSAGIALIKEFEGFKAVPYLCSAGIPTIGYGSTYYLDGTKVRLSDRAITETKALELLSKSLAKFEATVNEVNKSLTQNQFDACVALCYNIGQANFSSSTLVKMLNARTDPTLVAPQFLRWNKVVGKPSEGLTRRREAEMTLFLKD